MKQLALLLLIGLQIVRCADPSNCQLLQGNIISSRWQLIHCNFTAVIVS